MNVAQVKAELAAIKLAVSNLEKQVEADGGELEATPLNMSIRNYAKHAQVSEKTVRRWLKAGLPHVRRGKIVRIRVADADNWNEEDATRRAAEMDAHGAKR